MSTPPSTFSPYCREAPRWTSEARGRAVPQDKGQQSSRPRLHHLKITYEVDGRVIRVVEKQVTERYTWFLIGNSSWREW